MCKELKRVKCGACLLSLFSLFLFVCPFELGAATNFACKAGNNNKECAFSLFDHRGELIFLLNNGQSVTLNDDLIGARYCVAIINANLAQKEKNKDQNDIKRCWKGAVVKKTVVNSN
jgi:hypothetical protein